MNKLEAPLSARDAVHGARGTSTQVGENSPGVAERTAPGTFPASRKLMTDQTGTGRLERVGDRISRYDPLSGNRNTGRGVPEQGFAPAGFSVEWSEGRADRNRVPDIGVTSELPRVNPARRHAGAQPGRPSLDSHGDQTGGPAPWLRTPQPSRTQP